MNPTSTQHSVVQSLFATLKRLGPGLAIVGGIAVVLAISRIPMPKPDVKPAEAPQPNVNVLVVQPQTVEDTVELPGITEAWAVTQLSAEVPGRVKRIVVREGDPIRAGQPLIYLESDTYEADVNRARAQAEFDQQELRTMEEAHRQGVATNLELDRARSVYQKSKAELETAEVRLRRAIIRAPDTLLGQAQTPATDPSAEPPIIGVLNSLPVKEGMLVQPGMLIEPKGVSYVAEIVDIRKLKIIVHVPETDVRYVQLDSPTDQPAVIIQSLDNRRIKGTITFLSSLADAQTRTFRTEITIPNEQGEILAGMIVKVELLRQRLENAVMAPLAAVIPLEESGQYEIYYANDSKAHSRRVKVGLLRGNSAQLLDADDPSKPAMRAGEKLITTPRLVGDGQIVNIQPEAQTLLRQATQPSNTAATQPAGDP